MNGKADTQFYLQSPSVHTFDRNDAIVHPALRSRLKLQRRWWRIYLKSEFEALLLSLRQGIQPSGRSHQDNLHFLSNEIQPFLLQVTERIHHTHPNYDLEMLFGEVFREIPGVVDVERRGGRGDHGADLLVRFESGLPIPGLETEHTVVVQIKSYEGEHWDTQAVEDIRRAFEHYAEASMGLIISTATCASTDLEKAVDDLRESSQKPVALLIGSDVAAFLLRFGAKLLA